MTDKYLAYLNLLQTRDAALVNLAALALITVLAWECLRFAPARWRAWIQPAYLWGGLVLYIGTLIVLSRMEVGGL